MDFWTGDVVLHDDSRIQEITFSSPHFTSTSAISSSSLRFLSIVDTTRIPLYLAAGPSFDVWTTSPDTEEWFSAVLLAEDAFDPTASGHEACPWWATARAQSPTGILVEVQDGLCLDGSPKITEILFYGTFVGSTDAGLLTPPTSSHEHRLVPSGAPELRVHALPLSSEILENARAKPSISPPLGATKLGEGDAQFLAPLLPPNASSPGSPKRKRFEDMVDEATARRKKARRKGGEAVAAAASKIDAPRPSSAHRKSLSIDSKAGNPIDTLRGNNVSQTSQVAGRPFSRSPSFSSDIRPLSRKGLLDGPGKRSTLSRVTSISATPEEQTIESRNKDALSRVVMAGMRMYGLQQRKKTNKFGRSSVAPSADGNDDEVAADEAAKDEEYKLIYHQTFKGAALALRKYIATEPMNSRPDSLRDVVDRFLAIFCTDPLAGPLPTAEPTDITGTPGSRRRLLGMDSVKSHKSPFDNIKHSDFRGGEGGIVNSPSVRKGNREAG